VLRLERAVVVAFAVLLLSYLVWLPSFEGPDEPEHIAHVRAWATGASIEVPAEGARPEWGYQIVQPPLYYALAGVWSRVVGPEFTDAIAINPTQNPGFPFIRHDVEGERFPWSGAHRGLRWLRLPSVVFGLLTAWVLVWMGRELFGSDSWSRALWLAAVLLTPNIVQAFASVSNDGLAILAASVGLAAAVAVIRSEGPATRWAGLCGLALGIAIGIKLTAVIAAATAATILVVGAVRKKDLRTTLTTLAAALLPLIVCVAALLASNQLRFGDATLETVRNEMLPAFVRPMPVPLAWLLRRIVELVPPTFGVDLAWQTVRLPGFSLAFFGVWLAACLATGTSLMLRRQDEPSSWIGWIGWISLFWALIFLVWMSRNQTDLQLRHLLVVWPVLMLPLAGALRAIPFRSEWAKGSVATLLILGLLAGNVAVLIQFGSFQRPAEDPDFDRDYHTYLYSHVRNPQRAKSYLRYGTHLLYDIEAAYRAQDWEGVVARVESEAPPPAFVSTAQHTRVMALAQLGRVPEALDTLAELAPDYPEARPTHVTLILSSRGPAAARALLEKYLAETEGTAREALLQLQQRVDR